MAGSESRESLTSLVFVTDRRGSRGWATRLLKAPAVWLRIALGIRPPPALFSLTEGGASVTTRPSLDTVLLADAYVWARRATCPRLFVGAVLARDGQAFAQGYNGAPRGLPHCSHPITDPCATAVHAEKNAIASAARHGHAVLGATLYATHEPCRACAGLLINAGVAEVVYAQRYGRDSGVPTLVAAGVVVREIPQGEAS